MRIAIVSDQSVIADMMRNAVSKLPADQVVWLARSSEQAVRMCAQETPDLLLMSSGAAGIGCVEATRQIMRASPCAIVLVTADLDTHGGRVFEAMGHGALDVVEITGDDALALEQTRRLLIKIETVRKLVGELGRRSSAMSFAAPAPVKRLVAIGSSAGGPAALATLLAGLPASFPAAIVLVQHVDAEFAQSMAEWLSEQGPLPVRLAREGDSPITGSVLLAGTSDHLVFRTADRLGYTPHPAEYVHRPSVDAFFHSINRHWLGEVVGVVLTGMGRDGALGLKAMRDKGHHTIAQDQASSAVYGMPKAAAKLDAAVDILSLADIAPRLLKACRGKP